MAPALLPPLLCGLLLAQSAADTPRAAWVESDALRAYEEPDEGAYSTDRLRRDERVVVRRRGPAGWVVIEPTPRSSSWIDREAVEELGDGRARIVARAAAVRPGSDSARLPGATWTVLHRGEYVELLDRPPLVVRQADGERRVWLAVRPPPGERRYVRADGLTESDPARFPRGDRGGDDDPRLFHLPEDGPARRSALASRRSGPIDPAFSSVGPPPPAIGLSPAFGASLARAEAGHRAVLALPMESWRLDRAREEYQALLAAAATPEERSVLRSRLDQVGRQEAASRAAREVAAIVERSRRRDAEVAAIRKRLGDLAAGAEAPYEAEGLLHRSSRLIDGRRVYALIADDGSTAAYLQVPPGLDAERLAGHRVGVRGESRFSDALRSRVIRVLDLDGLEGAP